jgi:hypothetical protein
VRASIDLVSRVWEPRRFALHDESLHANFEMLFTDPQARQRHSCDRMSAHGFPFWIWRSSDPSTLYLNGIQISD